MQGTDREDRKKLPREVFPRGIGPKRALGKGSEEGSRAGALEPHLGQKLGQRKASPAQYLAKNDRAKFSGTFSETEARRPKNGSVVP